MSAAQRFVVLAPFDNAAVLDKNTGLVWEQAPSGALQTWDQARFLCLSTVSTGGLKGWRLPSIVELMSLLDPSTGGPPGHPFTNVQSGLYWSATADANSPVFSRYTGFFFGNVLGGQGGNSLHHVWCVRGPMQESVY